MTNVRSAPVSFLALETLSALLTLVFIFAKPFNLNLLKELADFPTVLTVKKSFDFFHACF
jgi:hypothetical protein